jgi:predicted transcriptional regulator
MLASQYAPPGGNVYLPPPSALGPIQELTAGLGPLGSIANFLLDTQLRQQFAESGLIPYGSASSYYKAQEVERYRRLTAATQASSQQDEAAVRRLLRGSFRLAGRDVDTFDPSELENFDKLVQASTQMLTMMSIAPGGEQVLDNILGRRGSATAMGIQMMPMSRFEIDPLTGRMGISPDTLDKMKDALYADAYERSSTAESLGIGAGELGSLYSFLRTEGLIGRGPILRESVREALGEVGGDARRAALQTTSRRGTGNFDVTNIDDLSVIDIQSLAQRPDLSEAVIRSQVSQASKVLQGYTRSLAAIRELFGDFGQTASVPQLMNALKAITGNQLQRFSDDQVTAMVNDIQAVTRTTPLNVDQVVQAGQTARHLLVAQGFGDYAEQFAHQVAMSGIAAGEATRDRGITGFGAPSVEQSRQLRMSLDVRALGSEMANNLAALYRLRQIAPDMLSPEVAAVLEAVDQRKTTYTDATGREVSLPTTDVEFMGLVGDSGMDVGTFFSVRRDTVGNREALRENAQILDTIRNVQYPEMVRQVVRTANLRGSDERLTPELAVKVIDRVAALEQNITDPRKREAATMSVLAEAGIPEADIPRLTAVTLSELNAATSSLMGQGLVSTLIELGPEAQRRQANNLATRQLLADFNEALRPMNLPPALLTRVSEALQNAEGDPTANVTKVINEFLAVQDVEADGVTAGQAEAVAGATKFILDKQKEIGDKVARLRILESEGADNAVLEALRAEINEDIKQVAIATERYSANDDLKSTRSSIKMNEVQEEIKQEIESFNPVSASSEVQFPDRFELSGELRITGVDAITGEATADITQGEAVPGAIGN